MIKRIIFDIDGTLITGVNFITSIENALKKYGINDKNKAKLFLLNIKEYEKKYNYYDKEIYLKFFSEKISSNLDNVFLELFFTELKNLIPTNNDKLIEMLQSLKDYELVLLSNYFEESQRNRLKKMNINHYFTEYYGEKCIKPNHRIYIEACGKYSPNECLIIGDDKLLDIKIPKKIGFNTLFVNKVGDIKSVEEITVDLIKQIEKKQKSSKIINERY